MKMIGISRLTSAMRVWRSRPERPGSRTSSTRQLGPSARGPPPTPARDSCAVAYVATPHPADRTRPPSASRTDASSSTTKTIASGIGLTREILSERAVRGRRPSKSARKRAVAWVVQAASRVARRVQDRAIMNDRRLLRPGVSLAVIAAILTVGALHVGRAFFIPLTLALALHALLRPLVRGLERLRIPTPLGAAIIVLGAVAVGVTAAWSLSGPVATWVEKAPTSFANARVKLSNIVRPLDRLTDAAVGAHDSPPTSPPLASATAGPPLLARLLGGATTLVLGLAEVIVLLYLMLAGGLTRAASELLPDTESIVTRYLALSAAINACEGIAVGIVMWAIGMPDPLVWGLLTFALEFIPYLGAAAMVGLLTITGLADRKSTRLNSS